MFVDAYKTILSHDLKLLAGDILPNFDTDHREQLMETFEADYRYPFPYYCSMTAALVSQGKMSVPFQNYDEHLS